MPFDDLRAEVVAPALCASCGACELACPPGFIVFEGLEPRLRDGVRSADCGSCGDCLAACPGLDPATPIAERALFGRTRTEDERWFGAHLATYGARATSPAVFERSASGGSATTLLQTAMRCLSLDAVLVMGRSPDRPFRSAPELVTDLEDLPHHAQSTYQLAPYLGALRAALLESPGRRLGLVGLACHVQGVRKIQRLDSEIGRLARERLIFVVEIACSSGTTPRGTETLITDVVGVPLSEVTSVKYREGEYPGELQIATRGGDKHRVPFWKAVRHFAAHKTHRCLSCGDWMSGLADVSVADGDPNIFDSSLGLKKIDKHGMLFVRTALGARVFSAAIDGGALEAWPAHPGGLNLGLDRKRNRRASYERRGGPIPAPPIPGHRELGEVVSDAAFLATPEERASGRAEPEEGT